MKVYVVVSGEYSDFGINRVFLNKDKAKAYIKLASSGYDSPRILEMEPSDDQVVERIDYAEASFAKVIGEKSHEVDVEIKIANTLDYKESDINRVYFWSNAFVGVQELLVQRVLHNEYDEDKIKEKYTKVCYDLMAKIEALAKLEDWTEEMVNEWLDQNAEKYLQ